MAGGGYTLRGVMGGISRIGSGDNAPVSSKGALWIVKGVAWVTTYNGCARVTTAVPRVTTVRRRMRASRNRALERLATCSYRCIRRAGIVWQEHLLERADKVL